MDNSSDLSDEKLDKDLDETESASEQSDSLTWPSHSSLATLADGEDRTSYLIRQGLSAILAWEDQVNQGLGYQEHEHPEYRPQIERFYREERHHIKVIDTYFSEAVGARHSELNGYPPLERTVGVKQLEKSLDWLEMVDPKAGSNYRHELLSNHTTQYEIDKLEAEQASLEAVMENEETNLTFSNSNQQDEHHQQVSTLKDLHCTMSCTAYKAWGPIRAAFGPQIHLGPGVSFSFNLGFIVSSDQSNTNRESGVALSLSANKKHVETGVESRFSKKGSEHTVIAQANSSSGLTAGVEVKNSSFQGLLNPSNVTREGVFVVGCKLNAGPVEGKMRLCMLPFKALKKWVSSDSDQTDFNSNTLTSNDQNRIEFVLRQEPSQVDFPLNEVQSSQHHEDENKESTRLAEAEKESIEQQEVVETAENQDFTSFAEARAFRQANQVAMFTPPVSPPHSCAPTSTPFFNYLAIGLLSLGGGIAVFKLVYKFKTRNKD